jgi:hypothetical protein
MERGVKSQKRPDPRRSEVPSRVPGLTVTAARRECQPEPLDGGLGVLQDTRQAVGRGRLQAPAARTALSMRSLIDPSRHSTR